MPTDNFRGLKSFLVSTHLPHSRTERLKCSVQGTKHRTFSGPKMRFSDVSDLFPDVSGQFSDVLAQSRFGRFKRSVQGGPPSLGTDLSQKTVGNHKFHDFCLFS